MNFQKQIKELQERNREEFVKLHCNMKNDVPILMTLTAVGMLDHLNQLTTDSFNQGALAMIEEMRRVQYGTNGEGKKWVMMNDLEDHLKTLEAKIQEK